MEINRKSQNPKPILHKFERLTALPRPLVNAADDSSSPILTNEKCRKEFLVFVLRSEYFLNYILSCSSRTNIPKVNKEQLGGFSFPLPPIELQNQFAEIVKQIDKQKFEIENSLKEMQELYESLMEKYFG